MSNIAMNNEKVVNVAYAGNYKVFKGMLLSTLSLLKYYDGVLNVYILTADLRSMDEEYQSVSEEDIALLQKLVSAKNTHSTVTKLDVSESFMTRLGKSPNIATRYTAYTLLRLLLDEVAGIPSKLLYLDTDTMFTSSVLKLYDVDIENYELAGVKDRYGRFFMSLHYLNAGVLLLNMEKIKETGLFKKARALLNKKKVFLSDQTAINKYVKRKKILSRAFNEQKKERKDTVIRHFSMQFRLWPKFHFVNIKPWDIEAVHNILKTHHYDDVINEYLTITKGVK